MKNQKSVIVAGLILVFVAGFQLWSKRKEVNVENASSPSTVQSGKAKTSTATNQRPAAARPGNPPKPAAATGSVANEPMLNGAPSTPQERASLQTMANVLAQAIRPNAKQSDLMKALQKMKAEPFIASDNNAYTGDMDFVRTKNPLPGTRYFHAQYFGDGKTEKFVQHMSFEFKPGPNAIKEAVAAAQAAFKVGAPDEKRGGFSQWELADGYCVWISPLGKKDIQSNPFNAYTEQDIGSVRMAVELCPHDHQ